MSLGRSETWTRSGLSQQVVTEIVRERQAALRRVAELEAAAREVVEDFGWSESSGFGLKVAALRKALDA
jgi:hypothetical protein